MGARRSNPEGCPLPLSGRSNLFGVIPAFYPMASIRQLKNGNAGDAERPCVNKAVSVKRILCADSLPCEDQLVLAGKAGVNPARGVRTCNSEFVQRGWRGELLSGDGQYRGVITPATIGKSDGGEKLNHERRN